MADEYDAKEWTELAKNLNQRQLRNGLKQALRREAKRAAEIPRTRLISVGPQVKGKRSDWKRGIRQHVYSRGGGFLVTVKARTSRSGKEQGMHENRRGLKKPILMWMEDGTQQRSTRSATKRSYKRRKAHNTGRIYAFNFMKNSEAAMVQSVERNLYKDVEQGVTNIAKKAGFI